MSYNIQNLFKIGSDGAITIPGDLEVTGSITNNGGPVQGGGGGQWSAIASGINYQLGDVAIGAADSKEGYWLTIGSDLSKDAIYADGDIVMVREAPSQPDLRMHGIDSGGAITSDYFQLGYVSSLLSSNTRPYVKIVLRDEQSVGNTQGPSITLKGGDVTDTGNEWDIGGVDIRGGTSDNRARLEVGASRTSIGRNVTAGGITTFTESFVVRSNGDTWFPTGNVGIGTDSPRSILELKIPERTAVFDEANPTGTWGDLVIWNPTETENAAAGIRFAVESSDLDQNNPAGCGIAGVRSSPANEFMDLVFMTDSPTTPLERMRILADGKVGIGTTSPQSLLHVHSGGGKAEVRVWADDDGLPGDPGMEGAWTTYGVKMNAGMDGPDYSYSVGVDSTSTGAPFRIGYTMHEWDAPGDNPLFTINRDGKVSIGDGSFAATEQLHVDGAIRLTQENGPAGTGAAAAGALWYHSNGGGEFRYMDDSGGVNTLGSGDVTYNYTGNLWSGTNNDIKFSTGKVAIGKDLSGSAPQSQWAYGALQITQESDSNTGGIGLLNSGLSRTLRIWVDGSDVGHIDSGEGTSTLSLNADGGNVGIGTSDPGTIANYTSASTQLLQIGDGTNQHGALIVVAGAGGAARIDLIDDDSTANARWTQLRNDNGFTKLQTIADNGSNEQTFLYGNNSTGHIGLGHNAIGAGVDGPLIDARGTTNPNWGSTMSLIGTTVAAKDVGAGLALGGSFTGNDGTTNHAYFGQIEGVKAVDGSTTFEGDLLFRTRTGSGSDTSLTGDAYPERMRITHEGRVGIGTNSPIGNLMVAGSGSFCLKDDSQATPWVFDQWSSDGSLHIHPIDGTTHSTIRHVLNLQQNGNVGIGTDSPLWPLDVHGDIHLHSNTNVGIGFGLADGAHNWQMQLRFYAEDGGDLSFKRWDTSTSAAYHQLFLERATGNVGIGTDSPGDALTIEDSKNAGSVTLSVRNSYYELDSTAEKSSLQGEFLRKDTEEFRAGGMIQFEKADDWTDITNCSANMNFYTRKNDDLTKHMTIDPDGNVGIGTDTQTTNLHVYNEFSESTTSSHGSKLVEGENPSVARFQQNYYHDDTNANGNIWGDFLDISVRGKDDGHYRGMHISSGYGSLSLGANNTHETWTTAHQEHLTILNNGNVGIGTTSPDQLLSVKGDAIIGQDITTGITTLSVGSATSADKRVMLSYDNDNNKARLSIAGDTSPAGITIDDGGNVGIGTNMPAYDLDVAGDINFTGTLYQNGTPFAGGGGGGGGGSSVWSLSGNDAYYDNGSVGIGTSNPDVAKLNIKTGGTASSSIFVQNSLDQAVLNFYEDTQSNGVLLMGDKDGWDDVTTHPKIRLSTGGQNSYILAGNFGIGTTSPESILHLAHTDTIQGCNATAETLKNAALHIAHSTTPDNGFYIDENELHQVGDNFNLYTHGGGAFRFWVANDVTVGGSTTSDPVGPAIQAMTINPSGNVGIGTDSPVYDLDVAGDINFSGDLYKDGSLFGSGGSGQWTADGSDIYFDAGNVGIGTSAPNKSLYVKLYDGVNGGVDNSSTTDLRLVDGIWIQNHHSVGGTSTDGTYAAMQFGTAGTSAGIAGKRISDNQMDLIFFNETNLMGAMTIKHDGNVGIGTTDPKRMLHLESGGPVIVMSDTTPSGSPNRAIVNNLGLFNFGVYNNDYSAFESHMAIAADGNVGIGTDSPAARLHVFDDFASTIASTDITKAWMLVGSESAGMGIDPNEIVNKGANLNLTTLDDFDILFRTNAAAEANASAAIRMVIKNDGKVGIGTDSPIEQFEIRTGSGSSPDILLNEGDVFGWRLRNDQQENKFYIAGTSILHNPLTPTDPGYDPNWLPTFVNRLTILSGPTEAEAGNVGIGTDNPITQLDIVGVGAPGLGTSDGILSLVGDAASNGEYRMTFGINAAGDSWIQPRGSLGNFQGNLLLGPHSTSGSGGTLGVNVGIGDTSPSAKLSINGVGTKWTLKSGHTAAAGALNEISQQEWETLPTTDSIDTTEQIDYETGGEAPASMPFEETYSSTPDNSPCTRVFECRPNLASGLASPAKTKKIMIAGTGWSSTTHACGYKVDVTKNTTATSAGGSIFARGHMLSDTVERLKVGNADWENEDPNEDQYYDLAPSTIGVGANSAGNYQIPFIYKSNNATPDKYYIRVEVQGEHAWRVTGITLAD